MRNLFKILVIKGINWCVFICCINFVYLNCQPYCLFIVTLDTPTLCLCKVYSKHEYISPVNRPVDPKQIATEIINTPAFSL